MKKRSSTKSTRTHSVPAVPRPSDGASVPQPTTPSSLTGVHRRLFDLLAPHEVSVPGVWERHATPDTVHPGCCFDRSFRFVMALPLALRVNDPTLEEIWLVHGEYWIGQRHAWVELPGGVVFDGPYQRFYDRAGYYKAVGARPWYMYSWDAASMMSAHMPENADGTIRLADWHDDLGLPWADPENPTRIGSDELDALLEKNGLKPRPRRSRKKPRDAH